MKVVLRFAGLLALIAAIAAGVWFYRSKTGAPQGTSSAGGTYTQIVQAQRGNLSSAITVVGQLEAVQQADLAFEKLSSTTPVQTLNVAAGNTVNAGDVLATVDPATYQQAVDQAKSDLQAAEETLADLETPATELEISQADLAVAQAQQALEQAKADLADLKAPAADTLRSLKNDVTNAQEALALAKLNQELAQSSSTAKSLRDIQYSAGWHDRKLNDYQQLVSAGKANKEQTEAVDTEMEALAEARASLANISAQRQIELQNAAASVAAAEATLAEAKEALADAQKGGDALELAKAELAIKSAEADLVKAEDERTQLGEGADATDLATARADLDEKKLALSDAEEALAATSLVAPFDGTILQVNVKKNDLVSAATAVLTIASLDKLQVLASVDETTIRRVSSGQRAQVTFDALPGKTISGVVGEIPLQGALQGDVMVYSVPIVLEGIEELPLLVGMTADVTISTGDAENVLLVPTMALTKSNGMYQVQVADPNDPAAEPQAVPVQIGLSDGTYTQITAGLNEGDQVVVELAASSSNNNFGPGGMMFFEAGPGGPPQQRQGQGSSGTGLGR